MCLKSGRSKRGFSVKMCSDDRAPRTLIDRICTLCVNVCRSKSSFHCNDSLFLCTESYVLYAKTFRLSPSSAVLKQGRNKGHWGYPQ